MIIQPKVDYECRGEDLYEVAMLTEKETDELLGRKGALKKLLGPNCVEGGIRYSNLFVSSVGCAEIQIYDGDQTNGERYDVMLPEKLRKDCMEAIRTYIGRKTKSVSRLCQGLER